ncbi:MAG TPA: dihydroorotate dehydrogenase [Cytophagales bacterium]|nr:dihydroorotate dehydrogenase [Cytophagales bacterium]
MKHTRLIISLLIPLIIWLLPLAWIPLEGITVIEQRVIAIFLFAALSWVLEPIPIYTTSLAIILLELITLSDKGLVFLQSDEADYGRALRYQDILGTFASPIIILFLGGFFLAMAATKYRLDQNLARVLLAPFGQKPKYVMLGVMLITAVFSMFMSNTATTAMMLSIITPVLALLGPNDKGKIGLLLSVPVAANIGGIGTPIGTPPNAVALKYLTGENTIGFGEWMGFAVPYVAVLMAIGWVLLITLYPTEKQRIALEVKGRWLRHSKAYVVYATFVVTILLWLTDFWHGMNAYIVAMIPVTVFSVTGIITKSDLQKISWDVLWLVSGGIALGFALDETGLASRLIGSIDFTALSPLVIMGVASIGAALMANFMSNTATANLLLPLVAVIGTSLPTAAGGDRTQMIVLVTTIACSMGMALPISTPPNALAFGTNLLTTQQMAKPGVILAVVGLLLSYGLIAIMQLVGFFG